MSTAESRDCAKVTSMDLGDLPTRKAVTNQQAPSMSRPDRSTIEQPSALLRLPQEISDIIYGYLLTSNERILWPSESLDRRLCPAILGTCKQIYEEAGPLLYTSNGFEFRHPSDCTVFRRIMDTRFTPYINRVTICIKARTFERIWRSYIVHKRPQRSLYNDLPQLRTLTVVLEGSWWQPRWQPNDNLLEWFNHEVTFPGLCTTLDGTVVDRVGTDVKIVCRQRIPRTHFELLKRKYMEPQESDHGMPLPPMELLEDGRLRMLTNGKYHRDVVLELYAV